MSLSCSAFPLEFPQAQAQGKVIGMNLANPLVRLPLYLTGEAMLGTILLVVLVLLLLGALPTWPHSRSWGYAPTGGLGLVLIVVLILVLMDKI